MDNSEYVTMLLWQKQPEFAAALELAMMLVESRVKDQRRHRRVPSLIAPGRRAAVASERRGRARPRLRLGLSTCAPIVPGWPRKGQIGEGTLVSCSETVHRRRARAASWPLAERPSRTGAPRMCEKCRGPVKLSPGMSPKAAYRVGSAPWAASWPLAERPSRTGAPRMCEKCRGPVKLSPGMSPKAAYRVGSAPWAAS